MAVQISYQRKQQVSSIRHLQRCQVEVNTQSDGIQVGSRNWAECEAWTHAGSNGANYSQAWVGSNAGEAFLVVMNGGDAEGLTETTANVVIGKLLEYWQEYIQ